MTPTEFERRLPEYITTGLVILTATLSTLWSTRQMYYEGWRTPFPTALAWLIPGMVCVVLTPVVLFLLERHHRRLRRAEGWTPPKSWLRRNLRYVLALGFPLLATIATSVYFVPFVLTRVDDGDRGARLIEGNGVTLLWAPEGPGWNWKQPWGGYPTWARIAHYGLPPLGLGEKPGGARHRLYDLRLATAEDMETTGLCRYLSEDGTTLMTEPQDIWRMPTADEIVRSLVRGGENAGCTWDGESGNADCSRQPNKDTPLWAPDESPIYYWSADEYGQESAWCVPYTGGGLYGGMIYPVSKYSGAPLTSYRCVREP